MSIRTCERPRICKILLIIREPSGEGTSPGVKLHFVLCWIRQSQYYDHRRTVKLPDFGIKVNEGVPLHTATPIVVIVCAGLNSYTLCLLYVPVYVLCVMLLHSFPVWLFPYYVISLWCNISICCVCIGVSCMHLC